MTILSKAASVADVVTNNPLWDPFIDWLMSDERVAARRERRAARRARRKARRDR